MLRRMGRLLVILSLIAVYPLGAVAADKTLQQVMRPDGVGLVLTGVNASQTEVLEGYDVGLWMITSDFKGTAEVKGKASTVLVVQNEKVTRVLSGEGDALPSVPEVPADGYLLLGSGMAHAFLADFKVGDDVAVISKERISNFVPENVVTEEGSTYAISAVNRGRRANELVVYTSDFGTHTLTNGWGVEAAIAGGEVVAVRDYQDNSLFAIPEDGFVISTHGSARTWLSSHLRVGTKVELTKGSVEEAVMIEQETETNETGWADFFAALDLTLPGLEPVSSAVQVKDWAKARSAFATYLRERDTPTWYFDWRDPLAGGTVGTQDIGIANDALKKRFTVIDIPYQFKGDVDWEFNPTTQPGSGYAANNEWTWQFNRHHFWLSMGRTYRLTKNEDYAKAFVEQMVDWVEKNPVPSQLRQGPGSRWRTIEAGIRMSQSWPNAFFLFLPSPNFTDEAIVTMVKSMVEHAHYLSDPQTGGNWLTMEMNGLYHVGVLFPEFKEAAKWRQFAAERMRAELDRQVYPDGAQFELTPGYHNVALDNFLGIVKIAELNGYELPDGYLKRVESMYDYNLYMMTPSGSLPSFNDSSGGDVVSRLWAAYQMFPERRDFLWAGLNRSLGDEPAQTSYAFPYAGYLIQRSGWDVNARYVAFDVGPFGYGHQHEDKLNFVLSAYGRQFVVDAGTYTYDNSKWRAYVRSPYGHNVAFVDELGQNRRAKRETFVTDKPSDYQWELTPEYEFAAGSYGSELEGFGSDSSWVATQKRAMLYVKAGQEKDFWVVADTFIPQDKASHLYQTIFHLDAPAVQVNNASQAVTTSFSRGANLGVFSLAQEGQHPVEVVKGQEEPFVQGWVHAGYRDVKAIPTLSYAVEGEGVQHMLYVFYPVSDADVPAVTVASWDAGLAKDAGVGAEITFADGRKYRVFIPTDDTQVKEVDGKALQGSVFVEEMP